MTRLSNQNTRKPLTNRGYLLIAVVAIVLLGGGLLTYRHVHDNSTNASLKLQQEQAKQHEDQKKNNVNDGKAAGDDSSTSGQDDYVAPTDPDNITITPSQANGQVTVTTRLEGYSDGTCTLTSTNGGKTDTRTAQVIFQAQFSTCAGFSIPTSTLGTGTWNFNLSVTAGGNTTTQTASLEVK